MVEERQAHLNRNSRSRRAHDKFYLTDSDEEAIVDFVEDHEALYDKTNEHFRTRSGRNSFGKLAICQSVKD